MKYKTIQEDPQIDDDIMRIGVAKVAKQVGVSRAFIYRMMDSDRAISEELYNRVNRAVRELL